MEEKLYEYCIKIIEKCGKYIYERKRGHGDGKKYQYKNYLIHFVKDYVYKNIIEKYNNLPDELSKYFYKYVYDFIIEKDENTYYIIIYKDIPKINVFHDMKIERRPTRTYYLLHIFLNNYQKYLSKRKLDQYIQKVINIYIQFLYIITHKK